MDAKREPERPRILGDFKLQLEVGRGGMGVVYRARQLSLNRDVAVKVLARDALHDNDRVLRFQREAALLGRLNSPHIVQVFTIGQDGDEHFLAMEFVEGTDLDKVLRARHDGRTAELPEPFRVDFVTAAVRVVRDVALGLGAAHGQGIVHRDVKPSNVLLANDGRALLGDFGLARDLSAEALTTSGMMLGTPFYMSPERFKGEDLTPSADVYALGAVLYECVTGLRPFESANPERLMKRILDDEPVPPRKHEKDVPRDLEIVILKCLEKQPEARYPDATALALDLSRFLAGEPIEASGTGAVTRIFRRVRRRRVSALALGGVAVIALAVGGKWWWDDRANRVTKQTHAYLDALDKDQPAIARNEIDALLAQRPDLDEWRFERAELAMREKHWEDAARDFRTLLDSGARSAAARTGFALVDALKDGHAPDAPSSEPTDDALESYYRGIIHQSRRELQAALADTERALELDPSHVETLYALGGIKERLGDVDGAKDALRKYLERRQRFDARIRLGKIHAHDENFEAAEAEFERATKLRPDSVLAWTDLVAARLMLAMSWERNIGDWVTKCREKLALARRDLESARKLNTTHFMIDFNAACLQVASDERWSEEAERLYQAAIAVGGRDAEWGMAMRIYFARTLHNYKEHERALDHLEEARTACPEAAHDYLWVSGYVDVARDLHRDDDAVAAIDVALSGSLNDAERKNLTTLRAAIAGRGE